MTNEVNNNTEESKPAETSGVKEQIMQDVPQTAETKAASETVEENHSGEIDFGAILEQFEQEQIVFHAGELVEGKVVGVSDHGVLVDFGYKSEGVIPAEEFSGGVEGSVSVGDAIEVVIKSIHSGDAPPVLSRSDAQSLKLWADIEEAYKNDAAVIGRIFDKTKGGLRVDLNGIEAFLPGSQIDSRPIRGLDSYIGQEIEAKIIKFSRRRNNVVLSRKVITDLVINEQREETLSRIDVGHVVEGTVKNLTEYGAFVDIGGIDGLLHVTDMSWGRIQNPAEQFKPGDHVQVKVLKLDRERGKIALGYKQLLPDPWSTVVEVYHVDSRIKGRVSSATEYGIFVELEPGVEGLVHVSEISWSKRSANPKRMFRRGEEVEVLVLGVDTDEKRISLGMKQLQSNPWDDVEIRYPVGSKVHGKVRNLTDFGAFVELEDGIDGLVHVSDITWARKLQHPKELLKKDQEVDAIITHIDRAGQRLSLSMKDLTPSAWEGFVATHRPGDTVKGKVTRFTSFGVFVELGEGLEGLCHISELSEDRIEKPEDVAQLGQELDFKILRIEAADQKIGLSHRAVGKGDEPIIDTRSYTSEAKGGMASLGELAKLKFGGHGAEPTAEPVKEESKKDKRRAKREAAEAAEVEESAAETDAEAAVETVETAETADAEAAVETPAEVAEAVDASAEAAVEAEIADETPAETAEAVDASAEAAVEAEIADETPAETVVPAVEESVADSPEEPEAEEKAAEAAAEDAEETAA